MELEFKVNGGIGYRGCLRGEAHKSVSAEREKGPSVTGWTKKLLPSLTYLRPGSSFVSSSHTELTHQDNNSSNR